MFLETPCKVGAKSRMVNHGRHGKIHLTLAEILPSGCQEVALESWNRMLFSGLGGEGLIVLCTINFSAYSGIAITKVFHIL